MKGLCYRCEHRAQFLETGRQPRLECGDIKSAVYGCYMFKPVKPVLVEPHKGEGRPITFNILSGRFHPAEEQPDLQFAIYEQKGKILPIWTIPDQVQNE